MTPLFIRRCISVCLLLLGIPNAAIAEISLQVLPYSGQQSSALKERLDVFTRKYVDEHSLVAKDYPYKPAESAKRYLSLYSSFRSDYDKYKDASTLYTIRANGHDYLAAIVSYNPLMRAEPHCKPVDSMLPTAHCEKIARDEITCHLFLFDAQSIKLESVTPLNITRDPRPIRNFWYYEKEYAAPPRRIEGWPSCGDVLAVASAKVVSDAILFTLAYSDSADTASKYGEPPENRTTILVLLRQSLGKLQVIQEDSCLGNPNRYGSIAAARKALSACNKADKRADPGEGSWTDITETQPLRK